MHRPIIPFTQGQRKISTVQTWSRHCSIDDDFLYVTFHHTRVKPLVSRPNISTGGVHLHCRPYHLHRSSCPRRKKPSSAPEGCRRTTSAKVSVNDDVSESECFVSSHLSTILRGSATTITVDDALPTDVCLLLSNN